MVYCQVCGAEIDPGERVGRREECPQCGADLHACRQCRFYDPEACNDCRETQADLIPDKEKSNYCDYFEAISARPTLTGQPARRQAEEMWEKFFGKK